MTERHERDEIAELISRYANMLDARSWEELSRLVFCDELTSDFSSIGVPVLTEGTMGSGMVASAV